MKIVVVGGTGLIGSQLVKMLKDKGHVVVSASPKSGVNAMTGDGLMQAMAGTDVVVDVTNSPTFEDSAVLNFFETSGRNLLAAESAAGVAHHVVLSIVGTDRLLGSGYFRGKMAQETILKSSKVPFTILRATQFFEFIGSLAQTNVTGNLVRLSPAMIQPVASLDVAAALAEIAHIAPDNQTLELAGPEKFSLAEIVARSLAASGDVRQVVSDKQAPYYGLILDDQSLMPSANAKIGKIYYTQWLQQTTSRGQS